MPSIMVYAPSHSRAGANPRQSAKPRTQTTFAFLMLPREVRNAIYELCLVDAPRWRRHHRTDCDMLLQHIPYELELRQAMACTRAAYARGCELRRNLAPHQHDPQQEVQEYNKLQQSSWPPRSTQSKKPDAPDEALDWMYLHKAHCCCLKRRGLGLLQANRQIHDEAATLFWSRNAFLLRGMFEDGLPTDHEELVPIRDGHLRMLRELHLLYTDEAHSEWKGWVRRLRGWVERLRPGYGRPARYLPVVASLGPAHPWFMWYSVLRMKATKKLCRGSTRQQTSERNCGQAQGQGRREQQGSQSHVENAGRMWHDDLTLARVGVHASAVSRFAVVGRWVS